MRDKKRKRSKVPEMSESEALRRAEAYAKDMMSGLEKLNRRPFSPKEYRKYLKKFEEAFLEILAKKFAIVPDVPKSNKNPR